MSSTSSEPSNLSGQSGEPVNLRAELKAIEEAELAPTKGFNCFNNFKKY